jgi:hypothetical protein
MDRPDANQGEQWQAAYTPPAQDEPAAGVPLEQPDILGWLLLGVPLSGGVAMAFLPSGAAAMASWASIAACAGLVALDAKRWRIWPATRWVVGTVLLWLVVYPMYLHARARHGAPKRLPLGLGVVAINLGVIILGVTAEPNAECEVHANGDVVCLFTNHGFGPGDTCVSVALVRAHDSASVRSPPLCSDRVWPGGEDRKALPGAMDPVGHCGGDEVSWSEACSLTVLFDGG